MLQRAEPDLTRDARGELDAPALRIEPTDAVRLVAHRPAARRGGRGRRRRRDRERARTDQYFGPLIPEAKRPRRQIARSSIDARGAALQAEHTAKLCDLTAHYML